MTQTLPNRVTAVASAAEAIESVRRARPDVLPSDVAMPNEDEYALIRRVHELGPDARAIPAAALTAYARREDRDRALAAGFSAHVAKPVEPDRLVTVVAELAGRTSDRSSR